MSEIDYNSRDLQISLMRLQEENDRLRKENDNWIKTAEKFSIKSKKIEYELNYIKSRILTLREELPHLSYAIDNIIENFNEDI